MIKMYPAEVYVVGIYCDKCGNRLTEYDDKYIYEQVKERGKERVKDLKYKYNCPNCGHEQIEDCPPTYQVVGNTPEKVEVENNV